VTRYLDLDLLLAIVDETGLQAVRDPGLLDSAGHRPRTTVFGENAYPTLDEKAAVLLESIVRNHPLIDGNERLGWLSAVILYRLNGVVLDAPEDPAYELVIGIAEGRVDYHESAATLASWTSTST
jgi:death-on-curing protein